MNFGLIYLIICLATSLDFNFGLFLILIFIGDCKWAKWFLGNGGILSLKGSVWNALPVLIGLRAIISLLWNVLLTVLLFSITRIISACIIRG